MMPPTESRITTSYFIQKEILKELAVVAKIGTVAEFIRSMTPDVLPSISPILMMMTTTDDIAGSIGWMNRVGIPAPLSIYVSGDVRHNEVCRIVIEAGALNIGAWRYWSYAKYAGHRRAYHAYIRKLAELVGIPGISDGYTTERDFSSTIQTMNAEDYSTMTWSALRSTFHGVDWTRMMTAWGLREERLHTYTFSVPVPFLHHFQSRCSSWPMSRWRHWLALFVAQWIAGASPQGPLRAAWFTYYHRYIQGLPADIPEDQLRLSLACSALPNTIGKLWVDRYCSETTRRHAMTMVVSIGRAAIAGLQKTAWMAPSTREAAVRKLHRMDIQVGWPEPWPSRTPMIGAYVETIMDINRMSTDENQERLSQGCRHITGSLWTRPVFEVNAYYYPMENRFVLPAASLRPPYYDPKKSVAWNYGAIGSTIGHELCHAFDSDGRYYDEVGNMRNWWTDHDNHEYEKRARQMVRLYQSRRYRGMNVDGTLTLTENIADLGGLHFALDGLRSVVGELTKEHLRDFFTSFAASWRSKDRLKEAERRLAVNSHAPPMLRVEHVVRQFQEWYDAFDIGPDSIEWIDPAHRIRLFG